MSWQLASFALVLLALALALWWYERSQPTAKLLAVVATLAALAALGRDAFAAVPDVKPITAIVLIGGVAFGAGPGFAIGAISALASNLLLGEGPWTPWQMLGWGVVGLIGAALGALGARRPPALLLALACACAAEVFNLILDLYTWTGTGNHSLRGFAVVLGAAASFDVTHVIASFAFALAFGPALLRMLARVRARLEVRWEPAQGPVVPAVPSAAPGAAPPALALVLCLAALAFAATPARAARRARVAASPALSTAAETARAARVDLAREVSFLARAQNGDGGFGAAAGQPSSELYSAWVAIGLAAAGRDPLGVSRGGHTVLDALRGEAASLRGVGDLERTILALHACGAPLGSLPGGDPVARLLRARSSDGSFGHLANLTAFGVLALRAAGYAASTGPVRSARGWLLRQQERDGGFGFATRGSGSDIDDTAAVLEALVSAGGRGGSAQARAVAFLTRAQNLDGGFPQQRGGVSNAQSSSWAIQALTAAGRDVSAVRRGASRSPLGYLESLVAPDGSVRYSRTGAQTPVWVTAQALTALAGRPFPISRPRARAALTRRTALPRPLSRGYAAARSRTRARAADTSAGDARVLARALRAVIGVLRASVAGLALSGGL